MLFYYPAIVIRRDLSCLTHRQGTAATTGQLASGATPVFPRRQKGYSLQLYSHHRVPCNELRLLTPP